MVDGPEAGLAALGALEADGRLAGYRYLPAAKADLLRRLGRATRPPSPTAPRWRWPTTTPSARSSSGGSPSALRHRSADPGG